jgi:hypothetical protein
MRRFIGALIVTLEILIALCSWQGGMRVGRCELDAMRRESAPAPTAVFSQFALSRRRGRAGNGRRASSHGTNDCGR